MFKAGKRNNFASMMLNWYVPEKHACDACDNKDKAGLASSRVKNGVITGR